MRKVFRFLWILPVAVALGQDVDRAGRALSAAEDAMRDRDYAKAATAYAAVATDFPKTPAAGLASFGRLRALYLGKQYKEALTDGADFLKREPQGRFADKTRYLMADAYARTGSPAEEAKLLQDRAAFLAGDQYRDLVSGRFLKLADRAFQGKPVKDEFGRVRTVRDYAEALELYRDAKSIGIPAPQVEAVDFAIADCLFQTHRNADAAKAYAAFAKEHEKSARCAEALVDEARANLAMGALAPARAAFDAVRRRFPDSEWATLALKELADALVARGGRNAQEGRQLYATFLKLHPDHKLAPEVGFSWPESLAREGKDADAVSLWRSFLAHYGKDKRASAARRNLAAGLERMGRYDDAIAEYRTFLSDFPDDPSWQQVRAAIPSALLRKASTAERQTRYRDAIATWERFLKEYPADARAPAILLEIAAAHGSLHEGVVQLGTLRTCAEKYPGTPEAAKALFRIARLLEEDGKMEEAIAGYERLLKTAPSSSEAAEARVLLKLLRDKHLEIRSLRVFSTSETPRIHIETRNIEKLQVSVYRVDLATYFAKKRTVAGVEDLAVDVVKPDQTQAFSWGKDYRRFRLLKRDLALPGKVAPGAYVVVVSEDDLTATALAVVSDLRCVVKASHDHLFAWTFHAGTDKPWPNVRLTIVSGPDTLEAATGSDGVVRLDDPRIGGNARVLASDGTNYATMGAAFSPVAATGYRPVGYVFTDRPLYRPGETVHVGAFLRRVQDGSYVVPAPQTKVTAVVTDSTGVELFRGAETTDDLGVLGFTVPVDSQAPLGEAQIRIQDGKQTFTGSFTIAEFRKPEFVVSAKAKHRVVAPGEKIDADLDVSYLAGGPVANAPIRWQVVRTPFVFDDSAYRSFSWLLKDARTKRAQRASWGSEVYVSGETKADAEGKARIEFTTDALAGDSSYRLEVAARDVDRLFATTSLTLFATEQDHFAVVKPSRKAVRPDEQFTVDLVCVDAAQRPVARKGKLVVLREEQSPAPVQSVDVATGADGRDTVTLKIERPGRYLLRYESGPQGPGRVTAEEHISVEGEEVTDKDARLVADRKEYLEGETARLFLQSPVTGGTALVTYEADSVIGYRFVAIKANSTVLEVPLTRDLAPNVWITVAIPGEDRLLTASEEITVFRYLAVSVEADPGSVGPGETTDLRIETRDARGNPVSAAVALGVVDDAIYSLANDPASGIRRRFYDVSRRHTVKTTSSFEFDYRGVTRPTNQDLLAAERGQGKSPEEEARAYVERAKDLLRAGKRKEAVAELKKALDKDANSVEAHEAVRLLETQDVRARPEKSFTASKAVPPGERAANDEPAPFEGASTNGVIGIGGGAGGGSWKGRQGGLASLVDGKKQLQDSLTVSTTKISEVTSGDIIFNYSAVGVRGAPLFGGLAAAGPAVYVRHDFRDTAHFALVRTDGHGEASVKVKMPENLTTWRAVVRGITATTLVGESEGVLRTKKDLSVRVSFPRFLTDRDDATATTITRNATSGAVQVATTLRAEGGVRVATEAGGPAPIGAGAASGKDWRLADPRPGRVRLFAEAKGDGDSDAAEEGFPVLAYGIPYADGWSGSVKGKATLSIDLPENAIAGATHFYVAFDAGVDGAVVDAVAYLEDYPYGCIEQTVNGFLPALSAQRALLRLHSPDAARLRDIREHVENGLRKLARAQRPDGSFGWWPKGAADPYVTALAVWGCAEAAHEGYGDAGEILRRAVQALPALARKLDDDGRCYLQWARCAAGSFDGNELNRLFRKRYELSAPALALLAMAHERAGREFQARALRSQLEQVAVRDADGVNWSGCSGHRWLFSDVEATAYALTALSAEHPLSGYAEGAARWLLAHRAGHSFGTTKETGPAAIALLAYLQAESSAHGSGAVVVSVNGKQAARVGIKDGRMEARGAEIPVDLLKAGRNVVELTSEQGVQVFYSARLSAVLRAKGEIAAADGLFTVRRRYLPVAAPEGPSGYSIVRPEARPSEDGRLPSLQSVRPGERVTVELAVRCRTPQRYVWIEDPLPAGCEVLEGHESGPFSREERRNDRMVFFAAELPAGRTVFTYRLQAVFPGVYKVLPATVGPMYFPATQARCAGASLSITEAATGGGEFAAPTPDGLWAQAEELLKAGEYGRAKPILVALRHDYKLRDAILEDLYAWLLRCDLHLKDSAGVVSDYEELRVRNPKRLPTEIGAVLGIGEAYASQGQPALACGAFRQVLSIRYGDEQRVASAYSRFQSPAAGLDYLLSVDARYPEDAATAGELLRIGRAYLTTRRPDGSRMLAEGLQALRSFTARFPGHASADEAAFASLKTLETLREHGRAVDLATAFLRRYPESPLCDDATDFLMEARFAQGDYTEAAAAARDLLQREYRTGNGNERKPSPFRPAAHHILGKIAHAKGDLAEAVRQYQAARDIPDAREALAFLQERTLDVPSVLNLAAGAEADVPVTAKNVSRLQARIYPVDLFILFAVRPSLKNLQSVDLTGIAPAESREIDLTGVAPYQAGKSDLKFALPGGGKAGAYLVAFKSGDLERSCLLLVSDMEVEMRRVGSTVRVYVFRRTGGKKAPAAGARVKISDGTRIRAVGTTDARGVFEAHNVGGRPAAVVEDQGQYALAR